MSTQTPTVGPSSVSQVIMANDLSVEVIYLEAAVMHSNMFLFRRCSDEQSLKLLVRSLDHRRHVRVESLVYMMISEF